jgi:hypothetical protein
MAISIKELMDRITVSGSSLYLMSCTDVIIYDAMARIVYVPESTHRGTNLNPMVDFRTHLGHHLLWSQHIEVACSSSTLHEALQEAGYQIAPYEYTKDYGIYILEKTAAATQNDECI